MSKIRCHWLFDSECEMKAIFVNIKHKIRFFSVCINSYCIKNFKEQKYCIEKSYTSIAPIWRIIAYFDILNTFLVINIRDLVIRHELTRLWHRNWTTVVTMDISTITEVQKRSTSSFQRKEIMLIFFLFKALFIMNLF